MLAALALATKAHAASPEVRAVRVTSLDFGPAVRVLTTDDVPPGEVVREGEEVVIRIPAPAAEGLVLPAVDKPLEAIRLEREPERTVVRVKVAPEVPFEASHEPGMLTVVFGEQPAPELRGPVTPELYQQLFPTAATDKGAPGEEEEGFDRGPAEGIVLGLHVALASRVAALARGRPGTGPVLLSGGVALNAAMVTALAEALGRPVRVLPEPQLVGALGAALSVLPRPAAS
jgi:hypothetical protein